MPNLSPRSQFQYCPDCHQLIDAWGEIEVHHCPSRWQIEFAEAPRLVHHRAQLISYRGRMWLLMLGLRDGLKIDREEF